MCDTVDTIFSQSEKLKSFQVLEGYTQTLQRNAFISISTDNLKLTERRKHAGTYPCANCMKSLRSIFCDNKRKVHMNEKGQKR